MQRKLHIRKRNHYNREFKPFHLMERLFLLILFTLHYAAYQINED